MLGTISTGFILIRGGSVILDGTRLERADILVAGDRIQQVGPVRTTTWSKAPRRGGPWRIT
jgi:dihydroorotase-like cyclic amidohydrolase